MLEIQPRIAALVGHVGVLEGGEVTRPKAKIQMRDLESHAGINADAVLSHDRVGFDPEPLGERAAVAE